MLTISLPLEEATFAEFQELAAERGTTAEALLSQQVDALTRGKARSRQSLEEAIAEARARLAALPESERNVSSAELQALIGILPPDVDAKQEYREHLERKYL